MCGVARKRGTEPRGVVRRVRGWPAKRVRGQARAGGAPACAGWPAKGNNAASLAGVSPHFARAQEGKPAYACPPAPVAYVVRCKCDPGSDGSGGETVVDHIRLFPLRPDVRWTYRVHEQILPSTTVTLIACFGSGDSGSRYSGASAAIWNLWISSPRGRTDASSFSSCCSSLPTDGSELPSPPTHPIDAVRYGCKYYSTSGNCTKRSLINSPKGSASASRRGVFHWHIKRGFAAQVVGSLGAR